MKIIEKIKRWYNGDIKAYKGELIGFYTKRHWTSKIVHVFVEFYLSHWKWIWGFCIAVLSLYLAYLELKNGI